MGYELYQSRHKGYEIDNLLDDVKEIKPKVDAMEQGYEANKVKMADGTVLPAFLATQMASKNDIIDMATNASVSQAISQATSDFVTGTEVDGKISQATSDFVTGTEVDGKIATATTDMATNASVSQAISQATGDFVTGSEVDTKISQATGDFVTGSEVDTKISQATGDFVTESDVEGIISDDFTNKDTLDDLSTSEEGNLLFKGQEIRGGGTDVEANPEGTATAELRKLRVGEGIFSIPEGGSGGTNVVANPEEVSTDTLTKLKVKDIVYDVSGGGGLGDTTPIGTIIPFMGNEAPKNYLICDGTAYSITKYLDLADFIKEQFGSYNFFGGNGTTTFAVPDLRGEFLRGSGTNSHSGQGSGANVGTHQDGTSMPYVYTNGYEANYPIGVRLNGDTGSTTTYPSYYEGSSVSSNPKYAAISKSAMSIGDSTAGSAYNVRVRPTNTSVLYCIKYTKAGTSEVGIGYENYSEDEIVIGKWIDGRPLYRILNKKTIGSRIVFNMTSATAPSPYKVYTSSNVSNSSWANYYPFSEKDVLGWASSTSAPQWITIDLGSAKSIGKISLYSSKDSTLSKTCNPKHLAIQGSNNNTNWTTILDIPILTWSSVGGLSDSFEIDATYRYFRFYVYTNNGGSFVTMGKIHMYNLNDESTPIMVKVKTEKFLNTDHTALYYTKTTDEPNSFKPDMVYNGLIDVDEATDEEVEEVINNDSN